MLVFSGRGALLRRGLSGRAVGTKLRIALAGALLAGALLAGADHARAATGNSGGVLVVRAKGAQIDEAAAALKAELGGAVVGELVVDEGTPLEAVTGKAKESGAGVVVGVGARAAQLALRQQVPVVHCMVLQDAASFDGDNSVGVALAIPARAQLAALKRVVPGARKVGVLYDPKLNSAFVESARAAAGPLGMSIIARPVSSSTAAPAALDDVLDQVDALLVPPDATVVTREFVTFLVARSLEKKVPVLAFAESLVKVGALMALAPSYAQNGKLCARLAQKVAAGDKPSSLRGTVDMTGTLVVNVATARRLGLTLSSDVLRAPTQVVGQ